MSRDPEDGEVTIPATLHKYLYASGDPTNGLDPTGRSALEEGVYIEISTGLTFAEYAYALGYGAGAAVRYVGGVGAIVKTPCWIAALFVRAMKDAGKDIELPSWADHLCLTDVPWK